MTSLQTHTEKGGVRYGDSFWFAINFTWPFARLTANQDGITIHVSVGPLWSRTFAFERSQIKSIRKQRGLTGTGIAIEHSNPDYPPFITYWTFNYPLLRDRLGAAGHQVVEKSRWKKADV
jgi:hypothetical protein